MLAFCRIFVLAKVLSEVLITNISKGDFMTSHGFIGLFVGSQRSVGDIAKVVSKVEGVDAAHVVEGPRYNIIAKIDLRSQKKTHKVLLDEIRRIEGVHPKPVDLWIIQGSYVKGNHVPEEE